MYRNPIPYPPPPPTAAHHRHHHPAVAYRGRVWFLRFISYVRRVFFRGSSRDMVQTTSFCNKPSVSIRVLPAPVALLR